MLSTKTTMIKVLIYKKIDGGFRRKKIKNLIFVIFQVCTLSKSPVFSFVFDLKYLKTGTDLVKQRLSETRFT